MGRPRERDLVEPREPIAADLVARIRRWDQRQAPYAGIWVHDRMIVAAPAIPQSQPGQNRGSGGGRPVQRSQRRGALPLDRVYNRRPQILDRCQWPPATWWAILARTGRPGS